MERKCIEQRFAIRTIFSRYYEFVEREIIPVDADLYEDSVNTMSNAYVGRRETSPFVIVFQFHHLCRCFEEGKERMEELESRYKKAKESWNNKIPIPESDLTELMMMYTLSYELSLQDLGIGVRDMKEKFDKYMEEMKSRHHLKDHKFIVILHESMTDYIHKYRRKYPQIHWYDPYVALSPLTENVYNVTRMLESLEVIRSQRKPGKHIRIRMKDTIASLEFSIVSNDVPGLCTSPGLNEAFYFAYYFYSRRNRRDMIIPKYEIDNEKIDSETKKPGFNTIINNMLNSNHKIVNLVLTQKMMKIYEADKPYYESKIAAYKNKIIKIYVDQNLMYNPLDSELVPRMEVVEMDENSPKILSDKNSLPKLKKDVDVSVKFNNFEKGNIVKIERKGDSQFSGEMIHYKLIV